MSDTTLDVRTTCEEHLKSLDSDILDYIVDMLNGDEEEAEKAEALTGFLVDSQLWSTEEEATAKCTELLDLLRPPTKAVEISDDAPAVKLMDAPLKLDEGDDVGNIFKEDESGLGGRLVDIGEAVDTRKKRKAQAEAERRATKAHYERIVLQRKAEEEALSAAAENAVTLRRKIGAYTGSIESKGFSLPNPGGGRDLLENASFTLVRGRVYGLIGRNGKGKSTLLRAVASRAVGEIPPELTVHYVSQEVQLDDESLSWTPVQFVVHADIERRLLLQEQAEITSLESPDATQSARLVEVQQCLEMIESDSAEERATTLLTNLGFSTELRGREMSALSGGWRVRTALAAAIFAKPDLLLLDEPTNHLSIGAVLWLSRELTTNEVWQSRTVIIVSHDRVFLDEVTSDTLHVSGAARQLTQSRGNYSSWAKRREQQQVRKSKSRAWQHQHSWPATLPSSMVYSSKQHHSRPPSPLPFYPSSPTQLTHGREVETKQREIKELRDFNPATLGSTPKAMKIAKMKQKQVHLASKDHSPTHHHHRTSFP